MSRVQCSLTRVCGSLLWAPLQARVTHWSQFVWDFPDWETPQSKANPLAQLALVLPGPPSAPCGGVWRPLLAQIPHAGCAARALAPSLSVLSPLPLRCCCLPLLPLSGPTRDSLQSEATRGTGPSASPTTKPGPNPAHKKPAVYEGPTPCESCTAFPPGQGELWKSRASTFSCSVPSTTHPRASCKPVLLAPIHAPKSPNQSWPLLIPPQSHRLYLRTSRVTAEGHVEKQHARKSIITKGLKQEGKIDIKSQRQALERKAKLQ